MPVVSPNRFLRYCAAAIIVFGIVFVYFTLVRVNPTTVALTLLLAILLVSAAWGLGVAIFMSAIATLCFNYFFFPPVGSFNIADSQNWVALGAFLATAFVASELSERARAEAKDANHRRREVERLYAFSQQLLVSGEVTQLLQAIPKLIVQCFEIESAAIYVSKKNELHCSTEASGESSLERLRDATTRDEMVVDDENKLTIVPVRLGVRPVGALSLRGPRFSRESTEAVASLVAIAIERTRAIEDLGKAEAAREGELLRTALLDSVTHEFRTPLTAIKASVTGLLSAQPLDSSQRHELLTIINEESDRLNTLITEVAEMAQLDAGNIEFKLESHDMREPVETAVRQCRRVLADHPVEVNLPKGLPEALFDPVWLKEVIVHLLENAAKYSAASTLITVSGEVKDRHLVTSVADRGVGIEEMEQAVIFDKFYRGKDQRYRVQGTGMGLAISKAIIEAHHGTMGVTSQQNCGSVFYFSLPLGAEATVAR